MIPARDSLPVSNSPSRISGQDAYFSPTGNNAAATASVLSQFARIPLGRFPSPVRCETLATGCHFWIKDDGSCSEIYSGNKLRKLEYLFARVQHLGKRVLVVHGDVESHTVRACGLLGIQAGLEVHAVVFHHRRQSMTTEDLTGLRQAGVHIHSRNSMLGAICHAHWLGWRLGAVVVPLGASTPEATLGYVGAALELLEQVRQELLPEPRRIYIPFATGGSVAGLMVGLALADAQTRVVAVQTVERVIANRGRLERLVKQTLTLLGMNRTMFGRCMQQLELIDHCYLGQGYRDIPRATQSAVKLAVNHGLSLEPTHSGKAFTAMLDALPEFPNGELLYWNTHDQSGRISKIEELALECSHCNKPYNHKPKDYSEW